MTWKPKPLSEILEQSGRHRAGDQDLPVLSITMKHGLVDQADKFKKRVASADTSNYRIAYKNELVVGFPIDEGVLGFQTKYPAGIVSPAYDVWKLNGDVDCHIPYLERYLRSSQAKSLYATRMQGAVARRRSLTKTDFLDLVVPFPCLNDQIRIAHLLGKVEALIAQRKQHLQQLDDLLKSVFLEMFGDPVRNEKGWDTKVLPELCIKITDGEHLNPQFSPFGMPIVMAGNVLDHTVSIRDTKFVEYDLGESFRKKCNPELSDVLLVSRGATIGRLCRVDTPEPFCLMGSVILLKPDHQMVKSTFLVAQLKHPALYLKLFKSSGSSAQQAIYLKDVKRLVCILPPKNLQSKFSDLSEQVESTKESYRHGLTDLESLYGALSQQAFKGELDLSRVPLPGIPAEAEITVAPEPVETLVEQGLAIDFPVTDHLPNALVNTEARKGLMAQWLEAYRGQLGSTPFSVQRFMAAAQTRLAELHPDNDFELGAKDYEHIKTWVFDALDGVALTQACDGAGNRVELKAAFEKSPA
jgi:type I restriction enzyme S subunit